jgi:hypothetical protein
MPLRQGKFVERFRVWWRGVVTIRPAGLRNMLPVKSEYETAFCGTMVSGLAAAGEGLGRRPAGGSQKPGDTAQR